jgi:hypothetical protein
MTRTIHDALIGIVDYSTARDAIGAGLEGWRPDIFVSEAEDLGLVGFYLLDRRWQPFYRLSLDEIEDDPADAQRKGY